MKRWLFVVLGLVAVTLTGPFALARSYEDVVESGYLTVAVYRDFAPYSWQEGDTPRGIDIDIGTRIADSMGLKVRWFWLTADENLEDDLRNAIWKGAVLDADKRKADIMLRVPYDREFSYGMDGYGLPRNELVHMFGPYHQESWALARDLSQTGDVRTLANFMYDKIGVEIDSLPDTFLTGTLRGRLVDNVSHFISVNQAMDALAQREVAAVAGMQSQLQWLSKERNLAPDISDDGLYEMGRKRWDIGIAVKQDYRQLGHVVEAAIESWVADGTLKKIFEQYGVTYQLPSVYQ